MLLLLRLPHAEKACLGQAVWRGYLARHVGKGKGKGKGKVAKKASKKKK